MGPTGQQRSVADEGRSGDLGFALAFHAPSWQRCGQRRARSMASEPLILSIARQPCMRLTTTPTRGVIVLSPENSWRSASLRDRFWERSVHLRPNMSVAVSLANVDRRDHATQLGLATVLDYVRQAGREGWWAVFEDDAILLPGCEYSRMPAPIPPQCWFVSMDARGYYWKPKLRLSGPYAQSVSAAGHGLAGYFLHSDAADHYFSTYSANLSAPYDLIIYQSAQDDAIARGRVCFLQQPGPRVVHDDYAQASRRVGSTDSKHWRPSHLQSSEDVLSTLQHVFRDLQSSSRSTQGGRLRWRRGRKQGAGRRLAGHTPLRDELYLYKPWPAARAALRAS